MTTVKEKEFILMTSTKSTRRVKVSGSQISEFLNYVYELLARDRQAQATVDKSQKIVDFREQLIAKFFEFSVQNLHFSGFLNPYYMIGEIKKFRICRTQLQ